MNRRFRLALLAALPLALAACMRGGVSTDPPVHLVLDMDFQPKLRAQGAAGFDGWSDGRAMRLPVSDPVAMDPVARPLVVARGSLPDGALANRDANGAFVTANPLPLTHKFTVLGREVATIDRGRDRYDIHCAICHGYSGQGGAGNAAHGVVGRRWIGAVVPNFHFVEGADNRVATMPDGEVFEAITSGNGKTMPAYGGRLSVEDRWAIVHYVRALQSLSK